MFLLNVSLVVIVTIASSTADKALLIVMHRRETKEGTNLEISSFEVR